MPEPLDILFLGREAERAVEPLESLSQHGFEIRLQHAASPEAALDAFKTPRPWRIILCEHRPPAFDARACLEIARGRDLAPAVVISGALSDSEINELMLAGARDVVEWDRLARLVPVILREVNDVAGQSTAKRDLRRILDALNGLSEGFACFDPEDRLIFANRAYKQFYGSAAGSIVPGTSFEEIVREGIRHRQFPDAEGRCEAWIAERMRHHRACEGPIEQRVGDHRWVLIDERRTPDGGIAGIRVDITKRREAELALRERETLLRLMADTLPIAVVNLDPRFRYRYANETAARWYGRSPSEIIGRTFAEVLGPTTFNCLAPSLERALAGTPTTFDASVAYPDGVTRHVRGIYAPSRGVSNQIIGIVAIGIDITDRHEADRRLRESEERFRGAFETAPHGMALVAPTGRFMKVNRALCDMTGYSQEELLELDCQSITHPDDLQADRDHVERALTGAISTFQMEKRYVRKDGSLIWAVLSASIVRTAQDEPLYFVSQILDLTERKKAEAQLLQAQKMEAVGQLTGGLAHDFNNILTIVLGNGRLLERNIGDDPVCAKRVRDIIGAAKRGSALTQRLLAFSRKSDLQPEPFDCRKLLADTVDLLRSTLGETVEVSTSFDDGLPHVYADPDQLVTALLNLANNARDAMPKGGTLSIEVRRASPMGPAAAGREFPKRSTPRHVLFSVSDTGVGIPEDHLSRIFEPFFTTKEVGRGTGLGLSMVYGFVEQSGGHIEVRSELGVGTTFLLYLPAAEGFGIEQPEQVETDTIRPHACRTILVVEDEPMVRDVAVTMLTDMGYRVLEARNGPEALARLDQNPDIDLVFTDVVMPGGMTGFELAERMRQGHPRVKVLFTTGYASTAGPAGPHRPDAIPILRKPYQQSELAERTRLALSRT